MCNISHYSNEKCVNCHIIPMKGVCFASFYTIANPFKIPKVLSEFYMIV